MFIVQVTLRPSLGQVGELRNTLKTWVTSRQAKGGRCALAESLWGPEGAVFYIPNFYDNLADAQAGRESVNADPETAEFLNKVTKLIRQPAEWHVLEQISAPSGGSPNGCALSVALRPALGKAPQIRELLSDWVDYASGKGQIIGLSEEIWGSEGAVFRVRLAFPTIAAADENRAKTLADPKYGELVSKLSTLLAAPASWSVREIVVPANN